MNSLKSVLQDTSENCRFLLVHFLNGKRKNKQTRPFKLTLSIKHRYYHLMTLPPPPPIGHRHYHLMTLPPLPPAGHRYYHLMPLPPPLGHRYYHLMTTQPSLTICMIYVFIAKGCVYLSIVVWQITSFQYSILNSFKKCVCNIAFDFRLPCFCAFKIISPA